MILKPPEDRVTRSWIEGILNKHHVDYSQWGTDTTLSLTQLRKRMERERVYFEEIDGSLRLVMHVVKVRIKYTGTLGTKILVEKEQFFYQSEKILKRGFPRVSETAFIGEEPVETAKRALAEELGPTESRFKDPHEYGDLKFLRQGEESPRTSNKWPPLEVKVFENWFELSIDDKLYRAQYVEEQSDSCDQPLKRTTFEWENSSEQQEKANRVEL